MTIAGESYNFTSSSERHQRRFWQSNKPANCRIALAGEAAITLTLSQLTAAQVMNTQVLSVYEGWSIDRLAAFFIKHGINGAPVIASDHELVGVVSAGDIFRFENGSETLKSEILRDCYREATGTELHDLEDLTAWSKNAQKYCTVHQIMSREIISVDREQPISQVVDLLLEHQIQRVFVTAFGIIVGVITATDLLKLLSASAQ